jgi:hypothetical protein
VSSIASPAPSPRAGDAGVVGSGRGGPDGDGLPGGVPGVAGPGGACPGGVDEGDGTELAALGVVELSRGAAGAARPSRAEGLLPQRVAPFEGCES